MFSRKYDDIYLIYNMIRHVFSSKLYEAEDNNVSAQVVWLTRKSSIACMVLKC